MRTLESNEKERERETTEDREKGFNPLVPDDCAEALIARYTSEEAACLFFSDSVPSGCLLDPYSRRTWNCRGRCFVNGIRCEYISEIFSPRVPTEKIDFLISLIGHNGANIVNSLGWSIMTQEEVSAISAVKKEEAPFVLSVLKLLNLVSEIDGKLRLTELGRIVHDYLLVHKCM